MSVRDGHRLEIIPERELIKIERVHRAVDRRVRLNDRVEAFGWLKERRVRVADENETFEVRPIERKLIVAAIGQVRRGGHARRLATVTENEERERAIDLHDRCIID